MIDMIDGRGRARLTVFKHVVKSLGNSRRSPELVPVQVSAEHALEALLLEGPFMAGLFQQTTQQKGVA